MRKIFSIEAKIKRLMHMKREAFINYENSSNLILKLGLLFSIETVNQTHESFVSALFF